MWSTILATYIGVSLYYTVDRLVKSIKQKTLKPELDKKWNVFVIECKLIKNEWQSKWNKKKEDQL